jgi:hypothetical protein
MFCASRYPDAKKDHAHDAGCGTRFCYSFDDVTGDLLAFNARGKEREVNVHGAGSRGLSMVLLSEDAGASRLYCWR